MAVGIDQARVNKGALQVSDLGGNEFLQDGLAGACFNNFPIFYRKSFSSGESLVNKVNGGIMHNQVNFGFPGIAIKSGSSHNYKGNN